MYSSFYGTDVARARPTFANRFPLCDHFLLCVRRGQETISPPFWCNSNFMGFTFPPWTWTHHLARNESNLRERTRLWIPSLPVISCNCVTWRNRVELSGRELSMFFMYLHLHLIFFFFFLLTFKFRCISNLFHQYAH